MILSLSEVLDLKGETRSVDAPIETDSVINMGVAYEIVNKKPVHISLSNLPGKKIKYDADIYLEIMIPCDRCLEPTKQIFDIHRTGVLVLDEQGSACEEDDEESLNYIVGYNFDIDGFVKEEVMIGFPMKVLCEEDCKGICKVCGANLNKGECGCDRTELDPRMAKIRDIFNQKEV